MRKQYELTDEQLLRLVNASKPIPYMVVGGVEPQTPQEAVNYVWQSLGEEIGFEWDTAEPVAGKSHHHFSAIPITVRKRV